VRIILRADSGFARESLMTWCEHNRIDYLFGLARNQRLVDHIAIELAPSRSPDRDPSRVGSRGLLARDGLTTTPRRPASLSAASPTSAGPPRGAGAIADGSWRKPNGCRAAATTAPIRASL
jgi:hypothetical protein